MIIITVITKTNIIMIVILMVKSALALIVLGVLVSHIIFAIELFTRKFTTIK